MSFTTPHKPYSTDQGHSRGFLPHEHLHSLQFITFRLHDSVPTELMEQWRREKATLAQQEDTERWIQLNQLIEEYADSGRGACFLKDERIARLVIDTLKKNDEIQYLLHCWCVMPNHVHVLVELLGENKVVDIVQQWRSYTAHEANKLLGRKGVFWMKDYYDRYIRNEKHYQDVRRYIDRNPTKAGLSEWQWSSHADQKW